ncbi:MAG: 30S ribosomal protein S3 [Proteobacteria bacterium]|nr:30S ribosomal protein S3 [Pseudomonadota bacterium]
MGQKVHPVGFRLGTVKTWDSRWYAEKGYAANLHEDLQIRKFLKKRLKNAQVSKIIIERAAAKAKVFVYAARPGMIIGKRCAGLDDLKAELKKVTNTEIFLNIIEVRKVEMDAQLVAENIGAQLQKRVSFRRAMKKSMQGTMRAGAKGVRIACAGRLGGADMGRREWYRQGRVPLHTLRADIDYGFAVSKTQYGVIGVKCWIFKGEILPGDEDGN